MMGALHPLRLGWAKRVATVGQPRRCREEIRAHSPWGGRRWIHPFRAEKFDAASKAAKSAQHRAIRHKSATPFKPTCNMWVACFQARRPPAVNWARSGNN